MSNNPKPNNPKPNNPDCGMDTPEFKAQANAAEEKCRRAYEYFRDLVENYQIFKAIYFTGYIEGVKDTGKEEA